MSNGLQALREPFLPELVKFRAGATTQDKKRALALAYVDPRAYMERMDEVAEWSDDYEIKTLEDRVFVTCRLSVDSVTRCDVGEEPLITKGNKLNENALTTAAAQAFKRACTKFGLGAYLYELPENQWEDYDDKKKQFQPQGLANLRRMLTSQAIPSNSAPPADTDTGEVLGLDDQFPFDITKMKEYSASNWAFDIVIEVDGKKQKLFDTKVNAFKAYQKLRDEVKPESVEDMANIWIEEVKNRIQVLKDAYKENLQESTPYPQG